MARAAEPDLTACRKAARKASIDSAGGVPVVDGNAPSVQRTSPRPTSNTASTWPLRSSNTRHSGNERIGGAPTAMMAAELISNASSPA